MKTKADCLSKYYKKIVTKRTKNGMRTMYLVFQPHFFATRKEVKAEARLFQQLMGTYTCIFKITKGRYSFVRSNCNGEVYSQDVLKVFGAKEIYLKYSIIK